MPTKKQSKKGKKVINKKKGSVSQTVTVNVLPKSRGPKGTGVVKSVAKPQFISQPSFSLGDVAKLISEVKKTPTPSTEQKSITVQTEKEADKIVRPVPLGRLKIDESIMNKLSQSRPSIPSIIDIEDTTPTFKYTPVSEYFKASPVPTVPPKKDSKVKKVVIGIENRRMGEEDVLARQVEEQRAEAAIQRQQTKLDYYNREMPFYEEEDIPYKPSIPEVEGIPLAEAEVKQKRKYVKSGKYSKKKQPQVIEEE